MMRLAIRADVLGGRRTWVRFVWDPAVPPMVLLTVAGIRPRTWEFGRSLLAEALLTGEAGLSDVRIYRETDGRTAIHITDEIGENGLIVATARIESWLDATYLAVGDGREADWIANEAARALRELRVAR